MIAASIGLRSRRTPALKDGTIHLWTVDLDEPQFRLPDLEVILSADERSRSDRILVNSVQRRFIVAHAALRILLSGYLRCAPGELVFRFGSHGKPALQDENPLRFNMSHSEGLALYAFCLTHEIGVDLERVHVPERMEQIAARYFSAREVSSIEEAGAEDRTRRFFQYWVRKEALLKATSIGLSGLCAAEIAKSPNDKWFPVEAGEPVKLWALHDLEPAQGYVGAVCTSAGKWELKEGKLASSALWNGGSMLPFSLNSGASR